MPEVLEQPVVETPKVELGDLVWESEAGKSLIQSVQQQAAQQPAAAAATTTTPAATPDDDEIVDATEYLTRQTGLKSWDEIKTLQTRLQELEQKAQSPLTFANEDSRKYLEAITGGKEDDLYEYLNNKRVLSKAADLTPQDAIRLHLQYTNKHYSPEDIQDVWEERYALPNKPKKDADEEEADFQVRMAEYDAKVAKVNRAINRDGLAAKEALGKMKPELIIPEIPKPAATENKPSEQDIQKAKAVVDSYLGAIPSALTNFTGFSANFKDEEVEIPIAYGVSDEEKAGIRKELESFAAEGFDANVFLAKRWMNPDGTVNVQQMAKDRYLLNNQDKIIAKFAQEGGAKRLAHERKLKNNVNVNGQQPSGTFNPADKPPVEQLEEAVWNMK